MVQKQQHDKSPIVQIVDYKDSLKAWIKILNYEWLNRYFTVEPMDEVQLSHPQEEIIDKGGRIFYALVNNKVVGTASLLRKSEKTYELGKMAVTQAYQGKGIGKRLLEHSLEVARLMGAHEVELYTNTQLASAVNLYKKSGFVEVPMDAYAFKRANLRMSKRLIENATAS